MEEYEIVYKYLNEDEGTHIWQPFTIMANARMLLGWTYLDLNKIKRDLNEAIDKLIYGKKFYDLKKLLVNHDGLDCKQDGFYLSGHRFSTLNEVEKAIKNKAFL